ncbi:MAG: glycoside hydrolase family 125 protein [Tannerellaceae bacterium]|nr:glycoside hydrolase family 125 protein [Tannerellaceae bacterium]
MTTRRDFLRNGGLSLAGLLVGGRSLASVAESAATANLNAVKYVSQRPPVEQRHFVSDVIEKVIKDTKAKLKDPKLAWMFENCFPSTLDTTCEFKMVNGKPDTFVITGDIHAMWLRDSSAQVFPHIQFANDDPKVKLMLEGVIRRQTECILIDPYANGFNENGDEVGHWDSDNTDMKNELHERKWEIDSLCYPIRLAYHYWKKTGDTSPFDSDWEKAMLLVHQTFIEQQRKDSLGPYKFTRVTDRQGDTLLNDGWGSPVNPVGLIVSSFRPSDDASLFGFLIPSNMFAITSLRQLAEMMRAIKNNNTFAAKCEALANEVEAAVKKYAIIEHPEFGKVYAFEVDGYYNHVFMDDANVPSLLAMPYLGCIDVNDPIYQNTRKLVLSPMNPYFFKGTAGEGIGGPHIGFGYIWPMSIIMRCNTTNDPEEICKCVKMLRDTDADTGFMHESFYKDNPADFTRSWFAWVNTLFGEMIYRLVNEGKLDILNSLDK